MKGINGKQIFTTVILFSVLIIAVVYFLVFQKNMEKRDALIASNETLKTRVDSLQTYYDEQQMYKDQMAKMEPEMDAIMSKYVSDVKEEDQIMQAVISQRAATIQYDMLNLAEKEAMLTIPVEIVQGANVEKYQNEIAFEKKTATYKNFVDYHNLKKVIQSIFDSEYNIGIKNITYVKKDDASAFTLYGFVDEETGEIVYAKDDSEDKKVAILEGIIDLEFYSVAGNGVEYTKPEMADYISGTEDFFAIPVETEEGEEGQQEQPQEEQADQTQE